MKRAGYRAATGGAAAALFFLLAAAAPFLGDWLWMRAVGYEAVFLRLLGLKAGLFGAAFLAAFCYLGVNLVLAAKVALAPDDGSGGKGGPSRLADRIPRRWVIPAILAVAAGAGLFAGLVSTLRWDELLRFFWGGDYGLRDPVYGRDAGFYLFRLPWYDVLQNAFASLSVVTLAGVLAMYVTADDSFLDYRAGGRRRWRARRHAVFCLAVLLCAWGWDFYLERFRLLYESGGTVHGAGYTDLHVVRLGLWILVGTALALAVATEAAAAAKKPRWLLFGAGAGVAIFLLARILVPGLVQTYVVRPSELELEEPYLERNIAFTRLAYGLDRVEERTYGGLTDLGPGDLAANEETLNNIRLWDWRPIRQTFRQTQEIRTYYKFYEVDVDRYHLDDGSYRQVMLSARELAEQLPAQAQTWVNRTLQFTHGYGLAMSLVSEKVAEGFPRYLVKDLPPAASRGLEVTQPGIYYGEGMPGYRIVDTGIEEFDYPRGDRNVYTRYGGGGGVLLDALWKKALFAWNLGDVNILLSSYVEPGSRIQLYRTVRRRVQAVAPFLRLDEDPYLVLSGGRLFWILDAYTVAGTFPYAEPFEGRLNYIRNSVKAVVDAYEGTVGLFVADPGDPVIGTYRRALPEVFRPLEEMPAELKAHLRYPEDLFRIQVDKYRTYHMTVPQVFYNREDLWTPPRERYAGDPIPMEPYYILMRLPDEEKLQYLVMTPLTPQNRDNMIAWMAARCDFPDYGQLLVYKLPKERLIYGPIQIEALIDQDDVISRQLSLWDQRGSRVIRGNLLVIPLGRSFLYVEPVYLIAEQTDIPQLKRVIVVYDRQVVMQPTLKGALEVALGVREERAPAGASAAPAGGRRWGEAAAEMRRAREAVGEGAWREFGRAMEELQRLLEAGPPDEGEDAP